jgi:raffinose/stachyose/melibiose transport system substrate-binding protein
MSIFRAKRTRASLGVVLVAVAAVCSLLAGGAGASSTQSPVTLRIMTNTGWANALNIVVANFQRVYPDIKIQPDIVPAASQATLYQTQFRSGNAPDILQLTPGRGNALGVLNYSDAGYLIDLAGRPWEKRVSQPQLVGAKQGKKLWTASLGVNPVGYAYNRDLFKQLGVKVPRTWAEMVAGCKKFADAGKVMLIYQGGDPQLGVTMPLAQGAADVLGTDPQWNIKRQAGKVTFAGSKWRRVFEQLVEAKNAGCLSPGTAGITQASGFAMFARGEGGIVPTTALGTILSLAPQFKIGILPGLPDKVVDTRMSFTPSWAVAVNASISSEKKAAALKFVDFIMRPKQTETFNKATGLMISGYVLKTAKFPDWMTQYTDIIGPLIKGKKYSVQSSVLWPNAAVANALFQGMVGQLTGQKTIDQALADMDTAFNKGVGG